MNRKKFLFIFLATVFGLSANFSVSAQRAKSKARAKPKIDVFGYYFLTGQVPKELADIDHLHLSTIDDQGRDAPLNGMIRLKAKGKAKAVDFPLTNLKRNEKAISFSSKAIRNVSYKFTGEFSKLGDFPANPPTKGVILEGQLTKFQGKNKIFDGKVSFRYEPGG